MTKKKSTSKKVPNAKTSSAKVKRAPKRNGLEVINVKVSRATLSSLRARAKKFAQGNLSALVRHAGLKYTPKRGEKISFDA